MHQRECGSQSANKCLITDVFRSRPLLTGADPAFPFCIAAVRSESLLALISDATFGVQILQTRRGKTFGRGAGNGLKLEYLHRLVRRTDLSFRGCAIVI